MSTKRIISCFEAKLYRPTLSSDDDAWGFLHIPKDVSDTLPRRGRTSVEGKIKGHSFQATLEPDGQLSHWLMVPHELQKKANAHFGEVLPMELSAVEIEPEPELPPDLEVAFKESPSARDTWDATTTIARVDWIHWIVSAKQSKTRAKRIQDACEMLASGKKRVCCFDPSGFYSKALSAPVFQP